MSELLIQILLLLLDVQFNRLDSLNGFETSVLILLLLVFFIIYTINKKIDILVDKTNRKAGISRRRRKNKR